ncbi:MAG: NADH-quinone oxidoreductase subunit N [Acidobacteria bacterium]|nr:MAG: NADH-quinone oxidoreductase subunit N [Acidobacteriota bacterium]
MTTARDLADALPILIPAAGGLWVLVVVSLLGDRHLRAPALHALGILALSGAAALAALARGPRGAIFEGAVLLDAQALAFHLIFLMIAGLTVLASIDLLRLAGAGHGEFYALILFAVFGMTMMAGSENLLTLFLGLEVLSISLYVLAGFTRDRVYSVEGALKYFLLGAFSTGFVLYGIALFYGATGRIDLRGIASHLSAARGGSPDPLIVAGAALLLIGLGFKVAAVPFHFWAPDVYQGSMGQVAGFMATGTKAAAFAALLRVLTVGLGEESIRDQWVGLLSVIAILTMIVGNVLALAQQNIKRMLAYSSIANAGYLLVAVVAGGRAGNGTATVLFYLAAYAFMTVGAFAVAALLGSAGEEDEGYSLPAFAGLSRRRPYLAAAMAIFMLSLTGIPPTGGFMGKFYIFKSAVDAGLYGLAAVGLLASVVGAFYYLRVVVQMYLREPAGDAPPLLVGRAEALAILIAALGTLWIGLFPSSLITFAQQLGP